MVETEQDREAKAMAEVNANTRQVVAPPETDGSLWSNIKTMHHAPCLRECLMYGTGIGLGFGFLEFLTERLEAAGAALKKLSPTRRQAKIGDVMVGTFVVTSIGTWVICRYQLMKRQKNQLRNIAFADETRRKEILEEKKAGKERGSEKA